MELASHFYLLQLFVFATVYTLQGVWKDNKFNGTGQHFNKMTCIEYVGTFEDGKPNTFPNEFNTNVYKMEKSEESEQQAPANESDEPQELAQIPLVRVDLPLDPEEINFVFDKSKISLEMYVVFQGPEYPDPNPPPVDEKKQKDKKKGKNEPDEVEIPMLKPDATRIMGESGRTIKLDLIKVVEPDA